MLVHLRTWGDAIDGDVKQLLRPHNVHKFCDKAGESCLRFFSFREKKNCSPETGGSDLLGGEVVESWVFERVCADVNDSVNVEEKCVE